MAKELIEIKGFFQGIISSPSEYDTPIESASYSKNIDPVGDNGMLLGIAEDEILSTKSFKSMITINDDTNDVLVGFGTDNAAHINTNLNTSSATNTFTKLTPEVNLPVSSDPKAFKYSGNVLFSTGNEETNNVIFVGKDKHKRFGEDPTNNYFSESAELKAGELLDSFSKVISISHSVLVGFLRDGYTLTKLIKENGSYKADIKSGVLLENGLIKAICPSSSAGYVLVYVKVSSTSHKVLKVNTSDLTVSVTYTINNINKYSISGEDWSDVSVDYKLNKDVIDIREHQGTLFVAEKHSQSNNWESLLYAGNLPASGNINLYDVTFYQDKVSNPVGSFDLSELNSSLAVNVKAIDEAPNADVKGSVLDPGQGFLFKLIQDATDGMQLFSYEYSYSNETSDITDLTLVDSQNIFTSSADKTNYVAFRTDNGRATGQGRGEYSDALGSNLMHIDTVNKLIVFGANPKTDKNVNPKIIVIGYDGSGNLQNPPNAFEVESGQSGYGVQSRESISFDYVQDKMNVVIGLRRPTIVPIYKVGNNAFFYNDATNSAVTYSDGSSAYKAIAQDTLWNPIEQQMQVLFWKWTGSATNWKTVQLKLTFNSETNNGVTYQKATINNNYASSWHIDSRPVQIKFALNDVTSAIILRYHNGLLKYTIPTSTAWGTPTELLNSAGENLSSALNSGSSSVYNAPIITDPVKGLLIGYDVKDANDQNKLRYYELQFTGSVLQANEKSSTLIDLDIDGNGTEELDIVHIYNSVSTKNTSIVTIKNSDDTILRAIDYSIIRKPITTPEGCLVGSSNVNYFSYIMQFNADTVYRKTSSDNEIVRVSQINIKWEASDNPSNEDSSPKIRAKKFVSGTNVEHVRLSNTQKNVNSCSSIVSGNVIAFTSKISNQTSMLFWTGHGIGGSSHNSTASLKDRSIGEFTKGTVCGHLDNSDPDNPSKQLHLFEQDSSGLWKYVVIDSSSPYGFSSINNTISNICQINPVLGSSDSGNFLVNTKVRYKFTFVYDGFQESPLSHYNEIAQGGSSPAKSIDLEIKLWTPDNISKRITGITIYRSEAPNNTEDWSFYRYVKDIPLDETWELEQPSGQQAYRLYNYTDNGKMSSTYQSITGVNEELKTLYTKFSVGHIYNGSLFTGNVNIKGLDDESTYIFKSQPNKPLVTDWSKDFVILPEKPTAISSFGNRIYAFSKNAIYRIEPNNMVLEHIYEGIGTFSEKSVVSIDEGLFFADPNGIYQHNGRTPVKISTPIDSGNTYSYFERQTDVDPILEFDSFRKSLVCFIKIQIPVPNTYSINNYTGLHFNLQRKRWDTVVNGTDVDHSNIAQTNLVLSTTKSSKGELYFSTNNGIVNYCSHNTTRRAWEWESKRIVANQPERDKKFSYVSKTGSASLSIKTASTAYTSEYFAGDASGNLKIPIANKTSKWIKIKLIGTSGRFCDSVGIVFERKAIGSGLSTNSTVVTF